jgi:hypothetical protein
VEQSSAAARRASVMQHAARCRAINDLTSQVEWGDGVSNTTLSGKGPSDELIRTWGFAAICIWVAVGAGLLAFGARVVLEPIVSALSGFIIAGLICAFIRPLTHAL